MKVVNGVDAVHEAQLFSQANNIDVCGSPFKQNIDSIPNQYPRTPQNQYGHNHANGRIGTLITTNDNRDAGQYCAGGTDSIGQHMKKRATDIEAFVMLSE